MLRQFFRLGRLDKHRDRIALIPVLSQPHSIEQFLSALADLPLPDFLRVAITAGYIDPGAPLGVDDVISLSQDRNQACRFVDHHLRLSGRERAQLLQLLASPATAQREMVQLLAEFATGPFRDLEQELSLHRNQAAARLQEMVAENGHPAWLQQTVPFARLESFSPVVLVASAFLDTKISTYYHEIQQPLFDGTTYEPFIICVGTERILSPTLLHQPRTQGKIPGYLPAAWPSDPLERSARVFGALSDPSRLKLVRLLAAEPRYGLELAEAMSMSAATISHHVNVLLKAGLLKVERRSHRTYYVLEAEMLASLLQAGEDFALGRSSR